MKCPSCGFSESKVVDSRPADEGCAIRRRRECLECGYRFTTYERSGESPLLVVKSDGSSEVFDREKLLRGLLIACAKRPISPETLEDIINGIESELTKQQRNEVRSKDLGVMVMERLADIDDVAYIRFMSVYQEFQSVEEFMQALKALS